MNPILRLLPALFLALPTSAPAQYGSKGGEGAPPKVTVTLVTEATTVVPGQAFDVGIRLDHDGESHTYWRNSGGFSLPTTVEWDLPEGWQAGELRWPTPERLVSQGFPSYAYSHVVHLVAEITPAADAAEGETFTLKASVSGQVCTTACVLYDAEPTATVTAGSEAVLDVPVKEVLDATRAELARPLDGWSAEAGEDAAGISLVLTPPEGVEPPSKAYFFSYTPDIDGQVDQSAEVKEGKLILTLKRPDDDTIEMGDRLAGVVHAEVGWGAGEDAPHSWAIDIPMGKGKPAVATEPPPSLGIGMLLLGLVGGLILNLMPCVFPVLGLKVMNFVNQAGEDHKKVVLHGVVFTVGVLVSFWVLAGVIVSIREATGERLSWGFQLQSPVFVLVMTLVLLVFSLSLAGLFEFGTKATSIGGSLTRKSGLSGSFFSGVLATLVATPCAAPFLAPALGAALGLPPLSSFLLFTAIAVGLSLPYLVLSLFPKLVNALPRPGAWMETFKEVMAFPMFATVAYLVWVLGQQVDQTQFLWLLFGLVLVSLGVYVYGHWDTPARRPKVRWTGRTFAAAFLALGVWFSWPKDLPSVEWEKWSTDKVAELREAGTPVFIDFTAAWCVTCQANKGRYTHDQEVIDLMEQKGVVALKADFTNKDPEIAAALASYGRAAVPVNILYAPGAEEPQLLPELFGAGELIGRFRELPDK